MPLVGGGTGGAGNPVGGSFTGPAEALEIIGDHCYSYSGTIAVSGSATTMNSFTTGNFYSILTLEPHGTIDQIGQAQLRMLCTLNGTTIFDTYWSATQDASLFDYPSQIIVPPYTEFVLQLAQATGSDKDMQTTITGTIYRTRD